MPGFFLQSLDQTATRLRHMLHLSVFVLSDVTCVGGKNHHKVAGKVKLR